MRKLITPLFHRNAPPGSGPGGPQHYCRGDGGAAVQSSRQPAPAHHLAAQRPTAAPLRQTPLHAGKPAACHRLRLAEGRRALHLPHVQHSGHRARPQPAGGDWAQERLRHADRPEHRYYRDHRHRCGYEYCGDITGVGVYHLSDEEEERGVQRDQHRWAQNDFFLFF